MCGGSEAFRFRGYRVVCLLISCNNMYIYILYIYIYIYNIYYIKTYYIYVYLYVCMYVMLYIYMKQRGLIVVCSTASLTAYRLGFR
jgi:hypothetical protein